MNSTELKQYVDAAIEQHDNLNLEYLIIAAIIMFFGGFLIAYIREKGKNTATKEDVGRITTEIESSKSYFTERMEHLRTDLSSRAHFGKVRYEREMRIYEAIWPKLIELRVAVLSLRPAMDRSLGPDETAESRKEQRSQRFALAHDEFRKAMEHNRPFYPPEIWKELLEVMNLCWGEAVYYGVFDPRQDREYWTKAMDNAKAINDQIDKTCEVIRSRLTAFDVA